MFTTDQVHDYNKRYVGKLFKKIDDCFVHYFLVTFIDNEDECTYGIRGCDVFIQMDLENGEIKGRPTFIGNDCYMHKPQEWELCEENQDEAYNKFKRIIEINNEELRRKRERTEICRKLVDDLIGI